MNVADPVTMTADAFITWALEQPSGRYELEKGRVLTMSPERSGHALTKGRVYRHLEDAVIAVGLDCHVYPDGMAVRIDGTTVYEPDALVRCGAALDDDDVVLDDPVIVVEVLSPSTERRDAVVKLDGYGRVASLRHYLIVDTESRTVLHHARSGDGSFVSTVHTEGRLALDPPGIGIDVAALFSRPGA